MSKTGKKMVDGFSNSLSILLQISLSTMTFCQKVSVFCEIFDQFLIPKRDTIYKETKTSRGLVYKSVLYL